MNQIIGHGNILVGSLKKHKTKWVITVFALCIYLLVNQSPVSHTGSDPRASLLLSQIIIDNQSIKMDEYKDSNYGAIKHQKNDHYYYYFPIGSSVSSIPFVWFERVILNRDMGNIHDESATQKNIASIVSVGIFLLLYSIARMYFSSYISIAIAFIFWLGTSLSSTLGQALWTQDFATLYAFLSLYLTIKITKDNKKHHWVLLGIFLFMAYLTRPTMSLLSIALIVYLFINDKKFIAVKTASLVGVLLGGFALFSLFEFHQILPDYYLPSRLSSDTFWIAFYGNLFSPSRGLFVFSPFLLLFLFNLKGSYKIFKSDKTLIVIASWIFLHLIVVSKFPHWWAGHSYGSRFMIDVLPAIYFLLLILTSYSYKNKSLLYKGIVSLFFIITVPLSIYFNVVQGLYNQYSGEKWNSVPNVDIHPEELFNWEYPQFLHNKERHLKRIVKPILPGLIVNHNSTNVVFSRWSSAETTHRWSEGLEQYIYFKIKKTNDYDGNINLHFSTLGKQKITILLNGITVLSKDFNGGAYNIDIPFDKTTLNSKGINTLSILTPNARVPGGKDNRLLAFSFIKLSFE